MSKIAYQPGDVVQEVGEPFIKVLIRAAKGIFCDHCFKHVGPLKRCNDCKSMFYCGRNCQMKDWKVAHKLECSSVCFRKLESDNDAEEDCISLRQLFRLWAYIELNPTMADKKFNILHNGSEVSYADIKRQAEDGTLQHNNPEINSLANSMAIKMNEDANLSVPLQTLIELLTIQNFYCYPMLDEDGIELLGFGLYLQIAGFEHSCKPNVYLVTNGDNIAFRAIAPIQIGDPVNVSYVGVFNSDKAERAKLLIDHFGKICTCQMCESEPPETVDYKELNELVMKLEQSVTDDIKMPFQEIVDLHEKVVGQFGKIYHKYDKRITSCYLLLLHTLTRYEFNDPELDTRRRLLDEINDHITITFGLELCQSESHVNMSKVFLGQAKLIQLSDDTLCVQHNCEFFSAVGIIFELVENSNEADSGTDQTLVALENSDSGTSCEDAAVILEENLPEIDSGYLKLKLVVESNPACLAEAVTDDGSLVADENSTKPEVGGGDADALTEAKNSGTSGNALAVENNSGKTITEVEVEVADSEQGDQTLEFDVQANSNTGTTSRERMNELLIDATGNLNALSI